VVLPASGVKDDRYLIEPFGEPIFSCAN